MNRVISRHRLPPLYRVGLTVLWVVPQALLIAAIVVECGFQPALFDPRLMVPELLMLVPAIYFWREGVDVLNGGVYRRMHLPQYVAFEEMQRWRYDQRVLTVWDRTGGKILECRAGHLTDFPALLHTIQARIG